MIGSDSPEGALDLLNQLKVRNDSVALLLADQRCLAWMASSFCSKRCEFSRGEARLAHRYADTNAAISAINEANINYFFLKPWDPPASTCIRNWMICWMTGRLPTGPAYEGIRVLGTRWSPKSYELRDFLARNHVPYQWIDVESPSNDPETKRLLEALGRKPRAFPWCCFRTEPSFWRACRQMLPKSWLTDASADQLLRSGDRGGRTRGLAAAVYGASEGLQTVMIEREAPGGQAGMSSRIENYLGFPGGTQRQRSGASRGSSGATFWSGNTVAAGGRWRPAGGVRTGFSRWRMETKSRVMP